MKMIFLLLMSTVATVASYRNMISEIRYFEFIFKAFFLLLVVDSPGHHTHLSLFPHLIGEANRDVQILKDFDQSQNSNLNTSLERPSQELLNVYFSLEIEQSKHKL